MGSQSGEHHRKSSHANGPRCEGCQFQHASFGLPRVTVSVGVTCGTLLAHKHVLNVVDVEEVTHNFSQYTDGDRCSPSRGIIAIDVRTPTLRRAPQKRCHCVQECNSHPRPRLLHPHFAPSSSHLCIWVLGRTCRVIAFVAHCEKITHCQKITCNSRGVETSAEHGHRNIMQLV